MDKPRADKAKLFEPRTDTGSGFPEDEVEVPGFGWIRVRGLNRAEVLASRTHRGDTAAIERAMLHFGLIDPAMTEEEAGQWQARSFADEIRPVVDRIGQLSGLIPDADKAAYKSNGGRLGAGVRALPSGEAVDDGDGAAPADATS